MRVSSKWPLGELSNPSCFVSTANRHRQKVDKSSHLHLFWGKGLPQVQMGRRIHDTVTEEGPGSAGQQHAEACVPVPAVEEIENRIPQQSRVQLNNLLSSLTQQQWESFRYLTARAKVGEASGSQGRKAGSPFLPRALPPAVPLLMAEFLWSPGQESRAGQQCRYSALSMLATYLLTGTSTKASAH